MNKELNLNVEMIPVAPGQKFTGPRGNVFYEEPKIVMPNSGAFTMRVQGKPVAVVFHRMGLRVTLRYCDPQGNVIDEQMPGDSFDFQMKAAIARMCKVILRHMGERHPAAKALAKAGAIGPDTKPVSTGTVH